MVQDRKNTHVPLNQDGGSVQVVTQKLDLGQTSMMHTHTERHIRDQTQISVADFSLDDSDNIFKMPQEFPSASLDIIRMSSASAAVST